VSLTCDVRSAYAAVVGSADADVIRRLSTDVVSPLRPFARVTELQPVIGVDFVERRYAITALFTELHVTAGDRSIRLLGLGPNGNINDFGNLAGELLKADLESLRGVSLAHPVVSIGPSATLCGAMNVFVQSEVHVTVAKALASPLESAKSIAAQLDWIVSEDYAANASAVLRSALRRGFASAFVLAIGGAALLGPLAAELVRRWPLPVDPRVTLLIMVAASVGAMVGAEWWTLRRFARRFDAEVWLRVRSLVGHLRILRTARVLAAVIPVVYGAVLLASAPRLDAFELLERLRPE